MAPKCKMTALVFQERYGALVEREYGHCTNHRTPKVALAVRKPPIIVSDGLLRVWFEHNRVPSDAVQVSIAAELQDQYGGILCAVSVENCTSYKLQRLLKARSPSVLVSEDCAEGVAETL